MSEFQKWLRDSMSEEEWRRFVDALLARLNADLMDHGVSDPNKGLAAAARRK